MRGSTTASQGGFPTPLVHSAATSRRHAPYVTACPNSSYDGTHASPMYPATPCLRGDATTTGGCHHHYDAGILPMATTTSPSPPRYQRGHQATNGPHHHGTPCINASNGPLHHGRRCTNVSCAPTGLLGDAWRLSQNFQKRAPRKMCHRRNRFLVRIFSRGSCSKTALGLVLQQPPCVAPTASYDVVPPWRGRAFAVAPPRRARARAPSSPAAPHRSILRAPPSPHTLHQCIVRPYGPMGDACVAPTASCHILPQPGDVVPAR